MDLWVDVPARSPGCLAEPWRLREQWLLEGQLPGLPPACLLVRHLTSLRRSMAPSSHVVAEVEGTDTWRVSRYPLLTTAESGLHPRLGGGAPGAQAVLAPELGLKTVQEFEGGVRTEPAVRLADRGHVRC